MLVARGEAARTLMPLLRRVLWAFVSNVNVSPETKRAYYEPAVSRVWRVSVRILRRRTKLWDWKFARQGHREVLGVMRRRRPDVARHFSIIITFEHLADPLELVSTFLHEYVHAVQAARRQTRREFGEDVADEPGDDERQARLAECRLIQRLELLARSSGFSTARSLIEDWFERIEAGAEAFRALVREARVLGGIEDFVAAAHVRQAQCLSHATGGVPGRPAHERSGTDERGQPGRLGMALADLTSLPPRPPGGSQQGDAVYTGRTLFLIPATSPRYPDRWVIVVEHDAAGERTESRMLLDSRRDRDAYIRDANTRLGGRVICSKHGQEDRACGCEPAVALLVGDDGCPLPAGRQPAHRMAALASRHPTTGRKRRRLGLWPLRVNAVVCSPRCAEPSVADAVELRRFARDGRIEAHAVRPVEEAG